MIFSNPSWYRGGAIFWKIWVPCFKNREKNHCGFGHKSGQNLLKIGDDPRFELSTPKSPITKQHFVWLCCWTYIFSPVQQVMSYKYNDTLTKNFLIGQYPGWPEWPNIFRYIMAWLIWAVLTKKDMTGWKWPCLHGQLQCSQKGHTMTCVLSLLVSSWLTN